MHEIYLLESVLDTLGNQAKQLGFSQVKQVVKSSFHKFTICSNVNIFLNTLIFFQR